jgi:hypothetical protein
MFSNTRSSPSVATTSRRTGFFWPNRQQRRTDW